MFTSFNIKRFRGFSDLTLDPLERVNLIVGKNNLGKTALLEALFLHLGATNAALPLEMNTRRGVRSTRNVGQIWRLLFFKTNTERPIELTSWNVEGKRTLKISLFSQEEYQLAPAGNGHSSFGTSLTASQPSVLLLEYQDETGQLGKSRAEVTPQGITISSARLPLAPSVFLLATTHSPEEDAERFSHLDRINRTAELMPILQMLEPRLTRLAVLLTDGVSLLHGDIGIGELLPIPLMGEGLARVLSILLAITSVPNGFVLIDEIENGIHYSLMQNVWQAIGEAARRSNVQLFATTHSWECIQAAHQAFRASGDLRLHRLDRIKGKLKAVSYDSDMLDIAESSDLEVR